MTPDHHVSDFFVPNTAQQDNTALAGSRVNKLLRKRIECLFQVDGFGSASSDDEAEVVVATEQERQGGDQKVCALIVEESRDDHDSDWVSRTNWLSRIWRGREQRALVAVAESFRLVRLEWTKVARNDSVWNDGDRKGIERSTKSGVLFAATMLASAAETIELGKYHVWLTQMT